MLCDHGPETQALAGHEGIFVNLVADLPRGIQLFINQNTFPTGPGQSNLLWPKFVDSGIVGKNFEIFR